MSENDKYIGYLGYAGKEVQEGVMDARKSAQALTGFDSAFRFFMAIQRQELKEADYELPVRIKKGSWNIWLPETLGDWMLAGGATVAGAYATAAATQLAKNDFKDMRFRDVARKSLEGMQWFLRIGKHLGAITKKKFESLKWRNNNTEVGIINEAGQYLYVPYEFLQWYDRCPVSLLSDVVEVVAEGREMNVGVVYPSGTEAVVVTPDERSIFYVKDSDDEVLFPELKHDQHVELEGLVTRGNEKTDSIGFEYSGHILTCYPSEGSVVRFKSSLFLTCTIIGRISRLRKDGRPIDRRPKIIFESLQPKDDGVQDLFGKP